MNSGRTGKVDKAIFPSLMRGTRLSSHLPPLTYMELILTNRCNMRCSYCFEADKDTKEMSEETVLAAIDFLMEYSRDAKKLSVLFFGGEPLIRYDLLKKAVIIARKKAWNRGKKISFDMTTNGTLINREHLRFFKKNNVKFLLSMDGGKEDHDANRRFPSGLGSFDTIRKKLPLFKLFQPWQGVKMTVTPTSALNLRKNLMELSQIGINQFIIGHAHGMKWTTEGILNYEQGLKEACELYLEMKFHERYFRLTLFEEGELGEKEKDRLFGCGAGRGRFCVDSQGDLYGCSKLATITGMNRGVLPFGNVHSGFTNIDNRLKFLVSSIGPREKCARCEFKMQCRGGCPAVNYVHTKSIYGPDDVSCKITFITKRLQKYMQDRSEEVFGKEPIGEEVK